MQARKVIEKGATWRVGNGHLIDVWNHRWLPDPTYSKIVSPRANSTECRASDSFYTNTRIWDPRRLESTFYPWEAEMVSRIRMSEACDEDLLVWPLTPDGHYSVQSAYCLLATKEANTSPSSFSLASPQSVWKSIWKIQAPNEIRHFIWRAAKDSLPTKQNLKAQHISLDETCVLCDDHQETLLRSLWLFERAQSVHGSQILVLLLSSRNNSGFLWISWRRCYKKVLRIVWLDLFTTIAWCLS